MKKRYLFMLLTLLISFYISLFVAREIPYRGDREHTCYWCGY